MVALLRHYTFRVGGLLCLLLLPLSVHAQQTIDEARQQGVGATVTVEGTVTRAYGDFVRFQDESGPTGASGLVVRQTSGTFQEDVADGTIESGTVLEVTGTLSEFNGLLQINEGDLDDYTVQGSGEIPAPQQVRLQALADNGENYESELVEVTGLSIQGGEGVFEYETSYPATDGTGSLTFRVQDTTETRLGGTSIPEGAFDYIGVVGEFSSEYNDEYQLIPVRKDELQPTRSFRFNRQFAMSQEGGEALDVAVEAFNVESGDEVSVTARVGDQSTAANGTDVTGFDSPQTLTFSGEDPAPQTLSFTPANDDDEEGVERLEVVLESSDGGIAAPGRFTLWILDDAAAQGAIAEGSSGDDLVRQLQDIYGNPPTLGYDIARDSLYRRVYNESGIVESFYTGKEAVIEEGGDASDQALEQNVNTEHIWPQSYGAGSEPARSDMHILVPAREAVNSARSNYPFGEILDEETDQWFSDSRSPEDAPPEELRSEWSELDSSPPREDRRFEPRHSVKGDVARAVFYFVTAYPNRADLSFYEKQKDTLLEWHRQDPVDSTEMRRNLYQASYQGNVLNPFVVDSTLVDRAYGSGGGQPGGQPVPINEARQQGVGAAVTIEGTVTRAYGSYVRLQDESGPTGASGLVIRQSQGNFQENIADGTIEPGTVLEVSGTLSAFNGLLQINGDDLSNYSLVGQAQVPTPQEITLADLEANGEDYESELVRVTGLTFPSASGTFSPGTSYDVTDDGGTTLFTFRVQGEDESQLGGEPIPSGPFNYEGVVGEFSGEYQLIPIASSDIEATLDRQGQISIDIEQSFGDASESGDYRLVALPGAVNRPLTDVLPGEAGTTWQAYWDDGTDSEYLVEFDEADDRFRFRPGRGFWVASTEDWTVEDEVEPVSLNEDLATTIPLNDGWTILSNPFGEAVDWSLVAAENDIEQPLFRFDPEEGFVQVETMQSAKSGTAYYFANAAGRDSLVLPYPSDDKSVPEEKASVPQLSLTAALADDSGPSSTVKIGVGGEAARAALAPPGRFEPVSLRIESSSDEEEEASRKRLLMGEQRPLSGDGETFDLQLTPQTDGPVELQVGDLSAVEGHEVVLLRPEAGTTHDLRRESTIRLEPSQRGEAISLRVAIGTDAYVSQQADQIAPEDLELATYPNPVRQQGTIEYALPEAQEVRIELFDVLGRQVTLLEEGRKEAGRHHVQFDTDGLSSGVYFGRLQAEGQTLTRKITVVR